MFLSRYTKHYNLQLWLCSSLLTLSSFNYAFDNQGFAATQAMDSFLRQFADLNTKTGKHAFPTWFTSAYNSANYAGFGVGVVAGSMISGRFGRRMSVGLMCVWAMISAAVCVSAKSRYQVLAGRILNQGYIGMELVTIPLYQAELLPAPVRGFGVGSYQMAIALGGLVMNLICRGTSQLASNAAWRIPFGLFFLIPSIVGSLVWLIPESPRWLLSQGRDAEAHRALTRIRVDNQPEQISAELELVALSLRMEGDKGTYAEMFRHSNWRRLWLCCVIRALSQFQGQAFTSTYGTIFVKSIGTINPFSMSSVTSGLNTVATILSMLSVDVFGRRTILYIGGVFQIVSLFTMAGCGLPEKPSMGQKSAIVGMLTVFSFGNSYSWAPLNHVLCGEIPPQRLRDKMIRTAGVVDVLSLFTVAFTLPYLLDDANLHSKVGFIYGSVAVLAMAFTYFCIPETKGRRLEEIDLMFEKRISAPASVHWKPVDLETEMVDATHGGDKGLEYARRDEEDKREAEAGHEEGKV